MNNNEKIISYLEEKIPELVGLATIQAYWQALMSDNSVLAVEKNILFEIFPDSRKKMIKELPAQTSVKPGQIIKATG